MDTGLSGQVRGTWEEAKEGGIFRVGFAIFFFFFFDYTTLFNLMVVT